MEPLNNRLPLLAIRDAFVPRRIVDMKSAWDFIEDATILAAYASPVKTASVERLVGTRSPIVI